MTQRTKTYVLMAFQMTLLLCTVKNSIAECPQRYSIIGTQCYHFSARAGINWYQAYFMCKSELNGTLVEIESQDEQNNLRHYIETVVDPKGKYAFWIGASDLLLENEFRWVSSGNLVTYNSWYNSPGIFVEPNNLFGIENCVSIFKLFDYNWDDIVCDNTLNFVGAPLRAICEAAPTTVAPTE